METKVRSSRTISKTLRHLSESLGVDNESYDNLQRSGNYILCRGFEYEKREHSVFMRKILLRIWFKLLIMLKEATIEQQKVLYKYITAIIIRDEFLLENCGYQNEDSELDEKAVKQLGQYIIFLKLTLSFTSRAIVVNHPIFREFAFTVITIALFRLPEYRSIFLDKMKDIIGSFSYPGQLPLDVNEPSPFNFSFIDKYIDSTLYNQYLQAIQTNVIDIGRHPSEGFHTISTRAEDSFLAESYSISSINQLPSENGESLIPVEDDLNSFISMNYASLDERDLKKVASSIPPAYVIRSDQTIFHDDLDKQPPSKSSEFCIDDHNFALVSIDSDYSENPYSTMNIQDILRSHQYTSIPTSEIDSNGYTTADLVDNTLPPLKLPNMNVMVDMMTDRALASKELSLNSKLFKLQHPSLFAWDLLEEIQNYKMKKLNKPNDVREGEVDEDREEDMIGDKYLDMQVLVVFSQSKALVAQFITFYMHYVYSVCNNVSFICWEALPGFFLFMRLFLIYFQDFYISKLSSGILRMNLAIDRVILDTVAYKMCNYMVVDGDVFNYVASILFDKCNVNVYLDISKGMMVLHNVLKAIREHNHFISYNQYKIGFYHQIYKSPEVRLLLHLQDSNQESTTTTQFITNTTANQLNLLAHLSASPPPFSLHPTSPISLSDMEREDESGRKEKEKCDRQSEEKSVSSGDLISIPTTACEMKEECTEINQTNIPVNIANDNHENSYENAKNHKDDGYEDRSSPLSLIHRRSGEYEEDEIDLSTFDILSHTQSTYNDSHSIIYTQHRALDLFYDTNFESTVRMRESLYNNTLTGSGARALADQFDKLREKMVTHGTMPSATTVTPTAAATIAKQPNSFYTHSQTPPPSLSSNERAYDNHDNHDNHPIHRKDDDEKDDVQDNSSRQKYEIGHTSLSSSPPPSHHRHQHHHDGRTSPLEHSLPSQWLVTNTSGNSNALNSLNSQLSSHLSKHSSTFNQSIETSDNPTPSTPNLAVITNHPVKRDQEEEEEHEFSLRSEICMAENHPVMMDFPTEGPVDIPVPSEYSSIPAANFFSNQKVTGFTVLQAIQFLLENNIIASRGEGLDFLNILQDRYMIIPVKYDRRFRTTIYRILRLDELRLFPCPEISQYNHKMFEAKINYVYLIYVLKGLVKMPHVQILEKVLVFIYSNEDFFNGEHRLMLYRSIIFPYFSLSLHTGIPTFATCSIDYLSTKCVEHAFPISLDIIVVGDLCSAF